MLQDQNAHGDDPHHDDRSHILDAWQLDAENLLSADGKLVAMVEQIRSEEERQEQFGEFARLERSQAGNLHPDACAVLFGTDHRQHRRQQQHDADHHADVRESPQYAVIPHEHHQQVGKHQCDRQPKQLSERHCGFGVLVEACDHRDADARQYQHAAHDRLVGVRLESQQQTPGGQEQRAHKREHPHIILRKTVRGAFKHLEERHRAQQHAEQQHAKLSQACCDHDLSPPDLLVCAA